MNALFRRFALLALGVTALTLAATTAFAATYFSQGNLAPNLTTSWNSVRAGGGSAPGNFTAGDVFVIQNTHNMTTTAAWTVAGTGATIQIESGGTLTANNLVAVPNFQVDNGGVYIHNAASGASNGVTSDIPGSTSRTFAASSTVEFRAWANGGTSPVALPSVTWGNLTINVPTLAGSWQQSGGLTTIAGNLNIQSTGGTTREFRLNANSPATSTLSLAGDLVISGGIFNVTSGSAVETFNIGGNFTQTGGTFTATGTGPHSINFTGGNPSVTLSTSGGTFTNTNLNWSIASGKTVANATNFGAGSLVATSRTMTVNGAFQVNQGSFSGGAGTWTYGASGSLIFNNTSGSFGVGNDPYWPSASGPSNVTVAGAGGITMNVARTVSGTFQTAAGVINGNNLTVSGTCQINSGGFFTGSPTYGASSTLIYNTGAFGVGNEWGAGASVGSGVPKNVKVQASGTVSMPNSDRTVPGDLTLTSGTLALNGSSGDLKVGGNFIRTGGALTTNSRAVFFNGSGAQSISVTGGSQSFDYLVVDKSAGTLSLSSSPATNVTVNATAGDVLQLLNSGGIDLGGNTLTLANAGGNLKVSGGARSISGTGTLAITGSKVVASASGGTLSVGASVTTVLSAGLDCGAGGVTTVNGTLRIDTNGFVDTNPPVYGANSLLTYNAGGNYGRGAEWSTTSGAGYPYSVLLSNSTQVDVGSNGTRLSVPYELASTLTINTGSALRADGLDGQTFCTTGLKLQVLVCGGTLGLTDLPVSPYAATATGNVTFLNPSTLLAHGGTFRFDGTSVQTLTGSATFSGLLLTNPAGLNVTSDITAQSLTLSGGVLDMGSNTLTIAGGGSVTRTSGFVSGNLRKTVPTGNPTTSFEVGSGSSYAPIRIDFTNVSASAPLTAKSTAGDHAQVAGSGIDASKSVNRTWTLTNGGVGFATSDVTLTYPAGDADGIATPANFKVRKYDAPNWSRPSTIAADATHAKATGIMSFSDFAVGEVVSRTITASAGTGGSISPSGAVSVADGSDQTFTASADACYHIADIVVDGSSVGTGPSYTFTSVTANHTIAASFALDTYTVTASSGGNGVIAPSGAVSVNCGANQTFNFTPDACYHVSDVVVDAVSQGPSASYTFTNMQANHTIVVNFALTTYTITASSGGNGVIAPSGAASVNCGANQTFNFTPDACYSVADVIVDSNSQGPSASYTFTNVQANHTISVSFALSTYTIAASAGTGGSISPSGNVNVSCGANQGFTIAADACYHIADVVVDAVSQGPIGSYTFNNVQANHTIAASFAIDTYTITASAGAGGSISPSGSVSVNCGASQSFTISADACYTIADVVVDAVSQGAISSHTFTNVQANHTITASFALSSYTITASAGADGSISPSGAVSVSCGASQGFTITANPGFHIADVMVDAVSQGAVASYTFTNVQANHTISASFAADAATIAGVSQTTAISAGHPCVTMPVNITRPGSQAVLGFSVTFQLSGNLALCAGTSSITEGTFLSSAGSTNFQVLDNGGGSYTVDGVVLGAACGPTATSGNLFNVGLASTALSGTGSLHITSVQLRDCSNEDLAVEAGADATVPIDNDGPSVTLTSPNGGESYLVGSSHAITWTASDPAGVPSISLSYSTDGGATYPHAIASGLSNSGSYNWTVPASVSTTVRVRVVAVDGWDNSRGDDSDADFTIRNPVITASAGAGGAIAPSGAVEVTSGANQTFTITPNSCYAIADVVVDGSSVGAVSSHTFTNVTVDHTIAASFTLNGPYTITASAGTGGSITPSGPVSVACGASQGFTIAADACYSIADVTVDGASQGAISSYTFSDVQANHTIAASFSLVTYTIAASAGTGGTITPNGNVSVNCGASQSFTIAADACYSIADVLVDGVSQGAITSYTFTDVQASHTIAASFSLNGPYTMTATAGAGGSLSPGGAVSVACGGSQSFTIAADACYSIADVKVDGASQGAISSYTFTNVQANHTIDASFSLNGPYTITATAGAGGSITPNGAVSVACGASQSFTIAADACYTIADVKVDGVSVGAVASYTFTNVQAGHTLDATFAASPALTITASAGTGGTIAPSGPVSVSCGTDQTFTIAADACYSIADVVVDGSSVGAVATYTFTNVQANHTIAASFAITTYTITATAGANGSIAPSGNVSVNCGADQAFTMSASAGYHIADVLVDGVSQGAIASYTFTNVQAGHTIAASFAANPPVPAITNLAAAQVRTGNDGDGTTKITLTWSGVAPGSTVQVYRAGFGNYPEYDDAPGAGSPPVAPSYPPGAPWVLTSVTTSGSADEVASRDYQYYVAFVTDVYATVSAVSNMTTGTLDYELGDVTDGTHPGQGDNQVTTADMSLLGAHYGLINGAVTAFAYLDVGPTSNHTPSGRPLTDDRLNFEDLVIYALNYELVSAPNAGVHPVAANGADAVTLEAPVRAAPGDVITVRLMLHGTGALQALSAQLQWNAAVVEPVSYAGGALAGQLGAITLSGEPGTVDIARLGRASGGLVGDGELATVNFRVKAGGDPAIHLAAVDARDVDNARVPVTFSDRARPLPTVTALAPAAPNPFRTSLDVQFALARPGSVDLAVYGVDGRRVRTLAHDARDAGEYHITWDGRSDAGTVIQAGVYYLRLVTPGATFVRSVAYLK